MARVTMIGAKVLAHHLRRLVGTKSRCYDLLGSDRNRLDTSVMEMGEKLVNDMKGCV